LAIFAWPDRTERTVPAEPEGVGPEAPRPWVAKIIDGPGERPDEEEEEEEEEVLLVVGHDGLPGGRRRAGRAGWAWILEETRIKVFRGERGPLPPHFDPIIFNRPEKGAGVGAPPNIKQNMVIHFG